MSSRYRLPLDPPALGDKLIKKMSRVKLDMIRFRDADGDSHTWIDYEVIGTVRACNGTGEGLDTVKALLREMLLGKAPEKMPDCEEGGCHE
ncbi:MAG: hypothetical protein IAF94_09435 [Pirellulaceae bacterium]|nr:hypothetical protein [Pirellulaceae bacterium]